MPAAPTRFAARMTLDTDGGASLGETRVRLLEAIAAHGSISQAAKAVPLSYKAAWGAVDTLNNLSPQPLVERVAGGRQGGGTRLTDYGRRVVAMYRALEAEYQAALDRVAAHLPDADVADVRAFRRLLRRTAVRASARNQFAGRVVGLRDGRVDHEVRLALDDTTEIVAVITKSSAENLQLAIGRELLALVKSSSVVVTTDRTLKLSTRNCLWGEVAAVHPGTVNDEVVVDLPGGRSVAAVVTHASVDALGLAPGVAVGAAFKSSSVILAALD